MASNPLIRSLCRGWRQLASRRMYLTAILIVPLLFSFYFIDLMNEGLPLKVPVSVVDLDHSQLSRTVTRNLGASELIDIQYKDLSYHDALRRVQSGETFGFFLIPESFQSDAMAGKDPTLTYYSNMTVFVPGTLSFKGFKTTAVTTTAGLVQTTLTSLGATPGQAMALISPVTYYTHPLGNPWTNYTIYLGNSFLPCLLALMVLLVTCFSVCEEIKRGTSLEAMRVAGGNIYVALFGKLAPQTLLFTVVGFFMQAYLFGFEHFPLNCPLWHLLLAMLLLVIGCQSFAVVMCSVVPNLRLSLSLCSLIGILSFSVAGFSFPVDHMYGSIGIFAYLLPIRWYFLIYIDQALNGIDLYYSRLYYVWLLLFPLVAMVALRIGRLRKRYINPIYVP
ncbi:MAG: ABC transporter permease [Paramuribaculum sp.]|nr:ABC transporter permease [Paramuribaculum sp.]